MKKSALQICAAAGFAVVLAGTTTGFAGSQATPGASSGLRSEGEIRQMLAERLDAQDNRAGIVVGLLEPQGRQIIAHGQRNEGDSRPLDGQTVFEIGSVTKVFTALLLAEMV